MPKATARVTTGHASRYLQQLSKHWSHRWAVTFDPTTAQIDLDQGRSVHMSASADALHVTASAADAAVLQRFLGVVEEHVRRFAFKETLEFDWTPET